MKTLLCTAIVALTCTFALGQQYNVLWTFAGAPNDGAGPMGDLIFDKVGNLYGTTYAGGSGSAALCESGCGTVFSLSPNSDGSWTETVLYNFCTDHTDFQCLDGAFPRAGLVLDANGNLYGTTLNGGNQLCSFASRGCGVAFELSPPLFPGGTWIETVLYNFCADVLNFQCLDGAAPTSQLALDAAGNLYGTTSTGGSGSGNGGTVFELTPSPSGWAETVLYDFCANGQGNLCPDGAGPQAGVVFDKSGNLYGTTELGGALKSAGGGTVYKLSHGANRWTESVLYALRPPFKSGANPLGKVSFDPLGDLYSTFSQEGQNRLGGVFQLSPKNGGTSRTFSFSSGNGGNPQAGVLVDAKRAALYGTTVTTVFEIVGNGQETVLHGFCPNCSDGYEPLAGLIEDKAGNLYGTTSQGGINNQGLVFEIIQSP
jgi:uncharacterized repeat protein (TIGR03803 family)